MSIYIYRCINPSEKNWRLICSAAVALSGKNRDRKKALSDGLRR